MTISKLILVLLLALFKHGNLTVRIFSDGINYPLKKEYVFVDEWNGKTELCVDDSA